MYEYFSDSLLHDIIILCYVTLNFEFRILLLQYILPEVLHGHNDCNNTIFHSEILAFKFYSEQ